MTATVPAHLHRADAPGSTHTSGLVRTTPPASRHVRSAGFEVALHEGAARGARAIPGDGRLCVVVGNGSSGSPVPMDVPATTSSSLCLVWAHADGSLQVRASWAPPALLVSHHSPTAMVPQVPGLPGRAVLAPGERLLVLSSEAFEAEPQTVARLLHESPAALLRTDADDLLDELFLGAPGVGGAVLTRL